MVLQVKKQGSFNPCRALRPNELINKRGLIAMAGVRMKVRLATTLVALTLGLGTLNTWANPQPLPLDPATIEQVKKRFETEFQGIKVDEVTVTPFNDVLELRLGKDVLYTNSQVDFVLQGSLVDVATRTDLTAQRLEELNRVDFADFPLDKAIKMVKGDGSRQVVIFEDPNCVYCKRLHQSLEDVDNVTVYSFLFPILTPDSRTKSEHVWCSEDRAATWLALMKENKKPTAKTCDTPIDELLQLGMKLGVQGTPAIFFSDGSRANGWLPADQLNERLEMAQKNHKK